MPYSNDGTFERASSLGHLPLANNERIRQMLAHYREPDGEFDPTQITDLAATRMSLPAASTPTRLVLSADGSNWEDEPNHRFPSIRVLYLQVSAVLVDLARYLPQSGLFVNPAVLADATTSEVVSGALPSSFLIHETITDPYEAFRHEVFDLFAVTQIQLPRLGTKSLLDVLRWVHESVDRDGIATHARQGELKAPCPDRSCQDTDPDTGRPGRTETWVPFDAAAPCRRCGKAVWPTDMLRLHDEWRHDTSNGDVAGRVRTAIEHLVLTGFAWGLTPAEMRSMAFVYDGPLAIFGTAIRLRDPILRSWQAVFTRCTNAGFTPPLIFGVEKSGYAVEHLRAIRHLLRDPERVTGAAAGVVMRLPDDYLRDRLQASSLSETYIGRRLFYCSPAGGDFSITVPPSEGVPYSKAADLSEFHRYPQLAQICDLVDRIGTAMYDDALIPIALAHRYAAIPLAQANSVLSLLTQDSLARS